MVSLLMQKPKVESWQGHILGGDLQSMGAREWGSLECSQGAVRTRGGGGRPHAQLVEERDA